MTFTHPNGRYVREEAIRIQKALSLRRAEFGSDDEIIGPAPAYVSRVRGRWRWQLTIRGRDPASLVRGFVLPPNWSVDVDPGSLA
jgi:primosomal protein N' (replication factor Y)